jgi:hypothetical protein
MIYTVGKIEIYEKYLNEDPSPKKDVGGSAWETLDDARGYLIEWYEREPSEAIKFAVYSMDADWQADTRPEPEDQRFRVITRQARLRRVLFREGGTLMRS